jgi:hypothetical protein
MPKRKKSDGKGDGQDVPHDGAYLVPAGATARQRLAAKDKSI